MVEAVEALPLEAPAGDVPPGAYARSRTSSATSSTRWCSTRCSRRRPARSPWPTSPRHPRQARAPSPARVRRRGGERREPSRHELGADQEGREGHDVDWSTGITPGLPSLLYTHKLFRKAASIGLEPGSADDALDRIDARAGAHRGDDLDARGRAAQVLAAAVVRRARRRRRRRVRARGWAAEYRARFEAMDALPASAASTSPLSDAAAVTAPAGAVSRGRPRASCPYGRR